MGSRNLGRLVATFVVVTALIAVSSPSRQVVGAAQDQVRPLDPVVRELLTPLFAEPKGGNAALASLAARGKEISRRSGISEDRLRKLFEEDETA